MCLLCLETRQRIVPVGPSVRPSWDYWTRLLWAAVYSSSRRSGCEYSLIKAKATNSRISLPQRWLDPNKPFRKQWTANKSKSQTNLTSNAPNFEFRVKFYVTDPSRLQEEYTRYQFYLQIKRDILQGRLPCPLNTACLLASYTVQGIEIQNAVFLFLLTKYIILQLNWVTSTSLIMAIDTWAHWSCFANKPKRQNDGFRNCTNCTGGSYRLMLSTIIWSMRRNYTCTAWIYTRRR